MWVLVSVYIRPPVKYFFNFCGYEICIDFLRCLKSPYSIFDSAEALDNRKIIIRDQLYPAKTSARAPTCFVRSWGETTVSAHKLCRVKSTLLMRPQVIDETSRSFCGGWMSTHLLLLMGLCLITFCVGDHCFTVRDGQGHHRRAFLAD